MAPTEARPTKAEVGEKLAELAREQQLLADSAISTALRIAQPCQAFSHGDSSGSTEAHTAAIAYATEAQVHATVALCAELRHLVLTITAVTL